MLTFRILADAQTNLCALLDDPETPPEIVSRLRIILAQVSSGIGAHDQYRADTDKRIIELHGVLNSSVDAIRAVRRQKERLERLVLAMNEGLIMATLNDENDRTASEVSAAVQKLLETPSLIAQDHC